MSEPKERAAAITPALAKLINDADIVAKTAARESALIGNAALMSLGIDIERVENARVELDPPRLYYTLKPKQKKDAVSL